jgi:CheY-like chemotaxis protein
MPEPAESAMASILVVEDDPKQLRLYAKALRGYRLTCVSSGSAALASLAKALPDLILLDNILDEGEKGVEFLPRLKDAAAHVPVIIISGTLKVRAKLAALQGPLSAHYILEKPVDLDELDRTVEIALTECGLGETVRVLKSLERAEKLDSSEPDRRFTERLARQHEILCRLRGTSERPNISALSREFNVSRRTIIRDLQDLIGRGQLPAAVYPEWEQEPADVDQADLSD